jgi:hypothetical protein
MGLADTATPSHSHRSHRRAGDSHRRGPPTQTAWGASPPPPPRPPRQWYQRPEILVPLGLVVVLLLGTGVYAATKSLGETATPTTTTQERHVITGTGTKGDDFFADGGDCQGTSGYDDVEPGPQVTVSDQSGTVIGNGALDSGGAQEGGCVFRFEGQQHPGGELLQGRGRPPWRDQLQPRPNEAGELVGGAVARRLTPGGWPSGTVPVAGGPGRRFGGFY